MSVKMASSSTESAHVWLSVQTTKSMISLLSDVDALEA